MIPEANNVYSIITAPEGMEPVLRAIKGLAAGGRASIYQSGYNGAETLRLRSDRVDFESVPLEDGVQHLFNGGVGGSLEEVVDFVRALSEALHQARIEHRFEIYDEDQNLVQFISA
jgi:hypothetical protein